MTQKVRIRRSLEDGMAEVLVVRESACSGDCHKCSGCGAAKETMIFTARNSIGASVGDIVNVESESGPVLLAAAITYMVPLMLFFVGYVVAEALGGGIGFLLGIALAVCYDRFIAKRKKTVYTITGYAK